MKKILLKLCLIMLLVIPCTFVFAACGNNDKDKEPSTEQTPSNPTPEGDSDAEPEVVVTLESIDVELDDEHVFVYDEESNSIIFVYSDEMVFEKDNFVVKANYSDDSSIVITDYEIDTAAFAGVPNIGEYSLKFTYEEKETSMNVKIEPKPIARPVNNWGTTKQYTFNENNGVASIYSPVHDIEGYDSSTMAVVSGSTLESANVGEYYIDVVPKSNYVWEANVEMGEESNSDAVRFEWSILRRQLFMSSPASLEFDYVEDETQELVFVDFSEFFKFENYFDIVDGTASAEEVGTYTVTVELKDEYKTNYYINDIEYVEGVDFEYNADRTQITYTWKIVE